MPKKIKIPEIINSPANSFNINDAKQTAIYTILTAVAIIIPFFVQWITGVNIPLEFKTAIIFILNTVLIVLKKYVQEKK